jgi:hypothetical protein
MSAKNSKFGSARTILRKRGDAYVAVRDEGNVTHIYRLNVVKSNARDNLAAEPDHARVMLEAAIPDVISGIVEFAWPRRLCPLNGALER